MSRFRSLWVCFKREVRSQFTSMVLLILLSLLAVGCLFYFSRQNYDDVLQSLSYTISLVEREDDPEYIELLQEKLAELSLTEQVCYEDLESAQARLAQNAGLMVIDLPNQFIHRLRQGIMADEITLYFNPQMPQEARLTYSLMKNIMGTLSYMVNAGMAYQEVYTDLGGTDDMSWLSLTSMVFDALRSFSSRAQRLEVKSANYYPLFFEIIASYITMASILPGILLCDHRLKYKQTAFQEKLIQKGGYRIQLVSQFLAMLGLQVLLLIPILWLFSRGFGLSATRLGYLYLHALVLALSGLFLAAALSNFLNRHRTGLFLMTLIDLLGFFLAGILLPLQLLPLWIRQIAARSPWHGIRQQLVTLLAGQDSFSFRMTPLLPALVPVLLLFIASEIYQRKQVA